MADIMMCKGGKCPVKEKCYRYRAEPTPRRQSYFARIPYKPGKSCAEFHPLNNPIMKSRDEVFWEVFESLVPTEEI